MFFMSKVSRYVGNIAGTNAYWNKVREELKGIITSVGPPTLFFTFSSADMHWPELHDLFKADTDSELGVVIDPHLADFIMSLNQAEFIMSSHLADFIMSSHLADFIMSLNL